MAAADSAIYAIVRAIPRGRVATYGQIAELAGIPSGHRVVARAMRSCPERLPWQRVVGKKDARRAQVVIEDDDHGNIQRALLEAEKVVFDRNGFISLRDFGWQPEQLAVSAARSRASRPAKGKKRAQRSAGAQSSRRTSEKAAARGKAR